MKDYQKPLPDNVDSLTDGVYWNCGIRSWCREDDTYEPWWDEVVRLAEFGYAVKERIKGLTGAPNGSACDVLVYELQKELTER